MSNNQVQHQVKHTTTTSSTALLLLTQTSCPLCDGLGHITCPSCLNAQLTGMESQSTPSWMGPTRVTKSNFQPHTAAPQPKPYGWGWCPSAPWAPDQCHAQGMVATQASYLHSALPNPSLSLLWFPSRFWRAGEARRRKSCQQTTPLYPLLKQQQLWHGEHITATAAKYLSSWKRIKSVGKAGRHLVCCQMPSWEALKITSQHREEERIPSVL